MSTKTRVYWWIEGAPEDRVGGPWWCKDFFRHEEANRFIEDLKPLCHKIMTCNTPAGFYPEYGWPYNIKPPTNAKEIK